MQSRARMALFDLDFLSSRKTLLIDVEVAEFDRPVQVKKLD
jgi:hypothetical protein